MTQRSKNKSNFKKGSVEMLLLHLLKTVLPLAEKLSVDLLTV